MFPILDLSPEAIPHSAVVLPQTSMEFLVQLSQQTDHLLTFFHGAANDVDEVVVASGLMDADGLMICVTASKKKPATRKMLQTRFVECA